jgi:hypothetical protein
MAKSKDHDRKKSALNYHNKKRTTKKTAKSQATKENKNQDQLTWKTLNPH